MRIRCLVRKKTCRCHRQRTLSVIGLNALAHIASFWYSHLYKPDNRVKEKTENVFNSDYLALSSRSMVPLPQQQVSSCRCTIIWGHKKLNHRPLITRTHETPHPSSLATCFHPPKAHTLTFTHTHTPHADESFNWRRDWKKKKCDTPEIFQRFQILILVSCSRSGCGHLCLAQWQLCHDYYVGHDFLIWISPPPLPTPP